MPIHKIAFAFLYAIHRPPQVVALLIDREKDLVQVPPVAKARAARPELIRILLAEFTALLASGFVGYNHPADEQEFFHVAVKEKMEGAAVTIVVVGKDAAPSNAFKLLTSTLEAKGGRVVSFLGEGNDITASPEGIARIIRREAYFVLVGASYPPDRAQDEIMALHAAQEADVVIPTGVYFDRKGAIHREQFDTHDVRRKVAVVFTAKNEDEGAVRARFPQAELVRSGNPEEEANSVRRYSRTEVREKLEVPPDGIFILIGLHKVFSASLYTVVCVDEALNDPAFDAIRDRIHIRYFPHPTDEALEKGINYLKEMEQFSTTGVTARLVRKEEMRTREAIEGADCSIGITGFNTRVAARLEVPAIEHIPQHMRNRLLRMDGTDRFEPCELGAATALYNGEPHDMRDALLDALLPDSAARLIEKQRLAYPPIEKIGEAVDMMAEAIMRYGHLYLEKKQQVS